MTSKGQRAFNMQYTSVKKKKEHYHLHPFFLIMFPRVISALWRNTSCFQLKSTTHSAKTFRDMSTWRDEGHRELLVTKKKTTTSSKTENLVYFRWKGEVRPSWSINLGRVKQVHSVLISYGHQVLCHLPERKKLRHNSRYQEVICEGRHAGMITQ